MYRVMVEKRTDETSTGAYIHREFDDLDKAQREAAAGRFAYPNGAVWVEDEQGNVIPASK